MHAIGKKKKKKSKSPEITFSFSHWHEHIPALKSSGSTSETALIWKHPFYLKVDVPHQCPAQKARQGDVQRYVGAWKRRSAPRGIWTKRELGWCCLPLQDSCWGFEQPAAKLPWSPRSQARAGEWGWAEPTLGSGPAHSRVPPAQGHPQPSSPASPAPSMCWSRSCSCVACGQRGKMWEWHKSSGAPSSLQERCMAQAPPHGTGTPAGSVWCRRWLQRGTRHENPTGAAHVCQL